MLLAAGRGERMEPLSSWIPKPALDVLGRPLLASALDHLRKAGCERLVVNLHRHPERVAAAARGAAGNAALWFSREPDLLGGAGGIAAARKLLGAGSVLVANADVWADLDLAPLLASLEGDVAALAVLPHPDPKRWSSVVLADDGRVSGFLPPGAPGAEERFLFTGFQLLGAEVVAALPPPPGEMAPVWDDLRRHGRLRGVVVAGDWREGGTPTAYRALVVDLLDGTSQVHPRATVGTTAHLERSWIGADCTVDEGTVLADCVVTSGARIGADCRLTACIVAAGADIAAGCALSDSLVLPGGVFPLSA